MVVFLTDNNTTPTKVVLGCFGLLVGLWQLEVCFLSYYKPLLASGCNANSSRSTSLFKSIFRQCAASIYHNVCLFVRHSATLVSLNAGTGEATLRCKDCDWLTWFMRALFLIISLVRIYLGQAN